MKRLFFFAIFLIILSTWPQFVSKSFADPGVFAGRQYKLLAEDDRRTFKFLNSVSFDSNGRLKSAESIGDEFPSSFFSVITNPWTTWAVTERTWWSKFDTDGNGTMDGEARIKFSKDGRNGKGKWSIKDSDTFGTHKGSLQLVESLPALEALVCKTMFFPTGAGTTVTDINCTGPCTCEIDNRLGSGGFTYHCTGPGICGINYKFTDGTSTISTSISIACDEEDTLPF